MDYSKKIYKKDSKGKMRILHVYTEGADLVQESGLIDGNLVTHRSTAKAKNVGKSNETTPEEQAILEAEAKVKAKLSEEYFETLEEAQDEVVLLPMLAKDAKKMLNKIEYPCYVQPKLDGQRAITSEEKDMMSRTGKAITTMDHILKEIQSCVFVAAESLILDGELYAHGLTFQENMKLIKKYRPDESEKVKYHVYDMIMDKPFKERFEKLASIVVGLEHVILVPTYPVQNEAEMLQYHAKFLNYGYEGTMIRHTDAPYGVNKRDSQLLKYKDFHDITCEVVDVVPSDKDPLKGVVHCKNESGTFGCGMKFSHAEREEILTNKEQYIGRMAEIRFFEYTDDGIPRFPVCVGFRNDK
jgi:DNA ligase-1